MLQRDDGYVTISTGHAHGRGRGPPFVIVLGLLFVVAAVVTYPVARRITRRLETLRAGVQRFGEGELSSRVEAEGNDEVAELAHAFNAAAGRIDTLVQQQSRVLASASHELRAPLTRLRMALSLLLEGEEPPPPAERVRLLGGSAGEACSWRSASGCRACSA